MAKRISLNAFDMTCVDHQSFGLWRHPRSRATEYNTIEYWTNLAQVLERGRYDALFLADAAGWCEVDQHTLRHPRHAEVFSLGDVCSSPNAKTAAAATPRRRSSPHRKVLSLISDPP